jgi:signal transduction histidine kinase
MTKSHILIVDDNADARKMIKESLVQEGYSFTMVASGPEALTYLETSEPDTILLDIMMPEMSGFEVCRIIKTDEKWQHIPIILVTGLNSKADLIQGFGAGADDFLSKPFRIPELQARVRSMLRIKKQHDELKEKNEQLEGMLQLREDLVNMLVHDMRTPLNSILGFSEILLGNDQVEAEYLEDLEVIHDQAKRLSGFINDILISAKMEQDELILKRSPVDVNQLVLTAKRGHSLIAESKQINLKIDLPEETHQLSLDPNLFQRVIDNLLSNALDLSPPLGAVFLQVEYPKVQDDMPPSVRVKVYDEGPGLPEEAYDYIFDKFKVVDANRRGASKFGLGLAFCKMVIEAHGGRIFVEPNQPKGCIFTVEI